MASGTEYDHKFFETIREGCQRSARAAVPVILDALDPDARGGTPETLIDVGCGEGWWAYEFEQNGVPDVGGIDGSPAGPGAAPISRRVEDLSYPLKFEGSPHPYDLAVSLEVAEHLPAFRASSFVADLCLLSPLVLFSAAMPRQGGTGHVNCQPPAYWAQLFAAQGYECSGALRWLLWENLDVEPWYRGNLLLFAREPRRWPLLFDGERSSGPLHVIPPDLWLAR